MYLIQQSYCVCGLILLLVLHFEAYFISFTFTLLYFSFNFKNFNNTDEIAFTIHLMTLN